MAGSQWHGYWDRRRLSVKRKEVSQSENDEIGAGTEKSSPSIVAPDLVDVYEFICRSCVQKPQMNYEFFQSMCVPHALLHSKQSSSPEIASRLGGPLLAKTGFTKESVAQTIDEWCAIGVKLSRKLGFNEFELSLSEKVRIYHYYVPVFLWCKWELELHTLKYKEGEFVRPLVIGISAPQGCGKTTIVDSLEYLFNSLGSHAAAISIDDFYLTASSQAELAALNCDNHLLKMRGNAGSHDLQLGIQTLKALCSLTSSGMTAKLPHYDKSANAGYGDRADPSKWAEVEAPLKVVLFEGWMLGFEPEDECTVAAIDPQLVAVNKNLAAYNDAWHKMIDSWIIIQVGDPHWVYKWRQQAEAGMRADGGSGMTDEQVADFVSTYMPAYKAYLPALYEKGPHGASPEHTLRLDIDEDRNPVG
ncbi:unnamed protein product [Sphagnum troendelagicum]|uniref:Phosphoribulokinase/uridine kinase domain-containing protein n=1 Tax=Sphagnum troendelagicum TaxID=128251 RepID=A0ABP0UBM3_9BRYO